MQSVLAATTLEKFLFQNAFMKYEEQMETYMKGVYCRPLKNNQCDLYKEFKGDVDSLFQYLVEQDESYFLEIHKICTRYQMERLWISDAANVFYYGPRGSFWMHSSGEADGDFYGKIASHNKEFVRTVMSAIKKIKGYEISDWD